VRAGRVLNRISAEDGARAGISDYERPRYIRIDRAKGNNSPASETRWATFANVTLPRGDDVGVMTLWVPPHLDKAQVTETHHRAAGVFLAILRRFNAAGRRVSDSKNAGNYAPRQFAQEREAREAAVSKALLQHVMNDMLSDGTIRIAEEGTGGRTKRAWAFTISAFCVGLFVGAENTTHGRFKVPFLSGHHHRHLIHHTASR
jgi:hypothetical protein